MYNRFFKILFVACTILWCSNIYGQDPARLWEIKPVSVWKFSLKTSARKEQSRRILEEIRATSKFQFQYPDSALSMLHKALNESIVIGDFERSAIALTNMGLATLSKGDFESSFKYFEEARKYIAISGTEKKHLPGLYVDIGAAYSYQNNYQKAFEYYYSILQYMLNEVPNDENIVMTQNNIADVLIRMEQYDRAMYYINQAEATIRSTHSDEMRSYLLANRANISLQTGDMESVGPEVDQGLALALKYDNKEAAQCLYILKANYYIKLKDPHKAIA